jgi:hypothetical protein
VAFAVLLFQVVHPFAPPLSLAAVSALIAMPLLLLDGPTAAVFVASYGRALDADSLIDRGARGSVVHEDAVERLARPTHIGPVVAGVLATLLRIFKQQLHDDTAPPPSGPRC